LYSKEIKTEDSGFLGYDTVIGQAFLDILKDYNAFILRVKQSESSLHTTDCSPNTQCCILEEPLLGKPHMLQK